MFLSQTTHWRVAAVIAAVALTASCGIRRAKYDNPINKDTDQPDKILFDKAIRDLEKGRFEIARLTLQTMMNAYDTSEFLPKAKLAYADSWFREGGTHGLAQAEAEYKDFILFYPTMEESAEAQQKVCMIHYRQMEKADRDPMHAFRAEDECRNLLIQFPNSKFAPTAEQLLRNIQEVIAEGEFRRGTFYANKGSFVSAASRFQALTDHYPLYSRADEANWSLGENYSKLGPRFRQQAGDAFSRVVREYPLSPLVEDAKRRLQGLELPVPQADPVAYARMKYELENRSGQSLAGQAFGVLKRGPNTSQAAKSGKPAMTSLRPVVPVSVPTPSEAGGFQGDVTISTVNEAAGSGTEAAAGQAPGTAPQPEQPNAPVRQPAPAGATGSEATATPATPEPLNPAPTENGKASKQNKQKVDKKKK